MFRKIGDALRRFMYGRYGTDQLNMALMVLGVVLLLIGIWVKWMIYPAYAVLIFYIYRCYSKNIVRRRKENAWFMRVTAPFRPHRRRRDRRRECATPHCPSKRPGQHAAPVPAGRCDGCRPHKGCCQSERSSPELLQLEPVLGISP